MDVHFADEGASLLRVFATASCAVSWRNRASHFELSETARVTLGYDALFNKTLFDPPDKTSQSYRAYFGPIKGLLGRPASFRAIDRQAWSGSRN